MKALRRLESEAREPNSDATESETNCPECDGQLRPDGDEIVCPDCGLVVDDEQIDHGPEWRAFDVGDEDKKSRTGGPYTERRHDRGLGGQIGFDDDVTNARQLGRMRHLDETSEKKLERNLAKILGEIRRICDRIDAGRDLVERACRIGRIGHEHDLVRGSSLEALAAAAVIAAIREQGMPIPMREVEQYVDIGPQADTYQMLKKVYDAADIEPVIVEPIEHVPRICSALDVTSEVERVARQLCLEMQGEQLHVGCDPSSVAGGAVYAAGQFCNVLKTQEDVSEAADVSRVTVRTHYHKLLESGVAEVVMGDD